MELKAVDFIQAMLAPGIMISACGLLILGMNNKYSLIVNRIRLLDEEVRRLLSGNNELMPFQTERMKNIKQQLQLFHSRVAFVRNAVVLYSLAVAFFIVTSVFIGLEMAVSYDLQNLTVILFLAGMLSVLTGIIFAVREVLRGYRIVTLELSNQQNEAGN
jgi:hypothetical protein